MTNKSWVGRCLMLCVAWWWLEDASLADAQSPLRAALFKTAVEQGAPARLARALDPVLAEQLGKLTQLTVVASPALDLPSVQLALDCVGETPSCLALAAERSGAEGVLSPSLARTDAEFVLSLLLYDPGRSAGSMRVVTRRVPRDAGEGAVLSAGTALVQELFGAPPPPAAAAPEPPPIAAAPAEPSTALHDSLLDPEPMPERAPSLIAPIALGIVGVIGLGAGVGFALAAEHAQDRYGAQRVLSTADAARADDRYDSAARSAMLANVSFGVGAAGLVAAAIVWLVQRPHSEHARGSVRPGLALAPGRLALTGGWP